MGAFKVSTTFRPVDWWWFDRAFSPAFSPTGPEPLQAKSANVLLTVEKKSSSAGNWTAVSVLARKVTISDNGKTASRAL